MTRFEIKFFVYADELSWVLDQLQIALKGIELHPPLTVTAVGDVDLNDVDA